MYRLYVQVYNLTLLNSGMIAPPFDIEKISNYEVGRDVEIRIFKLLKKLGWKTNLSPGSRGPADITASKKTTRWCIQVKFRGRMEGAIMKSSEWRYLTKHSKKFNCIPVIATVAKVPGNLMMNSNYYRDVKNPEIIRDRSGIFVGADLEDGFITFFHNILNGSVVEP